jgi:type IV pilus assembly protein PilX
MKPRSPRAPRSALRQQGVVLFVALIVLIIMTLAGLALMRQMGVGTSIAGNVAFKENATSVADRGTEFARTWLIANSAITANDSPVDGYLSSWAGGVDPTTFDWAGQSRTLVDDQLQTGNTARIIIQRLCAVAGMSAVDPAQTCSDSPASNDGASKSGGGYPSVLPGTAPTPFFRVTTRVDGPRNTVSYTQVLMQ